MTNESLPPQQLIVIDPVPVGEHDFVLWVVYDKTTRDFPGQHVARMFMASRREDGTVYSVPTTAHMVSDDIERIRETMVAHGRFRLSRDPADDPVIMESWV